ncbi:MAG: hypothetical protein HYX67_14660 [Candidatus Melainabacteria bacterium]|nr:hypothetical protein [Candidatus Melainabacteria bacterium]
MKRLIIIFVCLGAFFFWMLQPVPKQPFSKEAISSHLPYHPEWEARALNSEEAAVVDGALAQSYRYLGSGGQCYSFVSSDDQYVIKFFKQKAFALPEWVYHIPFLHEKRIKKKESKRDRVFSAFRLSFDELQDETGLLYVHLNRTDHLKRDVLVLDQNGQGHKLNLDETPFVVQKKAELVFTAIDALMQNGNIEGAKNAIVQVLNLNAGLYKRGYHNRDPNIRSNCGFVGDKAILFDVGRIVSIKNPIHLDKEIERFTPRLQRHIATRHPELLPHFEQAVAKIAESEAL